MALRPKGNIGRERLDAEQLFVEVMARLWMGGRETHQNGSKNTIWWRGEKYAEPTPESEKQSELVSCSDANQNIGDAALPERTPFFFEAVGSVNSLQFAIFPLLF